MESVTSVKSSKPKKQRKYFHKMAMHNRQKTLASHLSAALRKSIGKRSLAIRKEDKVKILRGINKGKSGKITRVSYKKRQVFIEGVSRKKSDGTEILVPLKPSNLLLVELYRNDDRRLKDYKKKGEK